MARMREAHEAMRRAHSENLYHRKQIDELRARRRAPWLLHQFGI
jgi:hypothetical protein